MTVSLVNDISGERTQRLAVLYCDISPSDEPASAALEIASWRVNHFRAARELAADYGGREATTTAGGWAATFASTIDALMCARALSSLVGCQTGGPSLSGGLSAGDVVLDGLGIGGGPVREAISLCHQALPRQVLVADPLKVVVARETARSFASAPLESLDSLESLESLKTLESLESPDQGGDGASAHGPLALSPWSPAIPPTIVASDARLRNGRSGRGGRAWRLDRRPVADRRAGPGGTDPGSKGGTDPDRTNGTSPTSTGRTNGTSPTGTGTAGTGTPATNTGDPSTDRTSTDGADTDASTPEPAALRLVTNSDPVAAATPTATTATTTATTAPTAATTAATTPTTPHAPKTPRATTAPTPRLRLTVLGWVQLEVVPPGADSPTRPRASVRGNQTRAVVSMLALKRGPVHKEELAELLWPAALPDHWEGAIRGLITKVRRFLDEGGLPAQEVLAVEGGYYELRLPCGVTVDRHDATTLIAEAKAALALGRPGEAVARARPAVAILGRRLLSGDNHTWFDQIRAELAHDRLAALDVWASAEIAAGNMEEAKRATTEALALDPYRESSYRLLMQAHAAAGSRGEALRTYERCRRMLADELGVGPAPQTQALYIHLLG